jgi:hypothetical protein
MMYDDDNHSYKCLVLIQLHNQRGSVKMLYDRIVLLRNYVYAVKEGKLPADIELLRRIAAVFQHLPTIEENDEWTQHYRQEHEDAILTAHLSTLTKAISNLYDMIQKFGLESSMMSRGGPTSGMTTPSRTAGRGTGKRAPPHSMHGNQHMRMRTHASHHKSSSTMSSHFQ